MPVKAKWVVRIIIPKDPDKADVIGCDYPRNNFGEFLECLRYAGIAQVHADQGGPKQYLFDLRAPAGVDTHTWAHQNAERMRSFGFNAAAAPEWK